MTPDQLRKIRKDLKLNQGEFGTLLQKHANEISLFETGKKPIPPMLAYTAAWFALFGTADPFTDGWRPGFQDV